MTVIEWIDRYAVILIAFALIGCAVAYRREVGKREGKGLRWVEWLLLPPGYAAVFILIQQNSVRPFALYPKLTLAACIVAALAGVGFVIGRRKMPGTAIAWLGGLLGMPMIVGALVLAGMYLQAPARFEKMRSVFTRFEQARGQDAPDFSFSRINDGATASLSSYRGRLVLVNVWATWCAPCLKEMPAFNRLQEEFGPKGLVVINLSDEPNAKIQAYLAKHPMTTIHGQVDGARSMPGFYQFGQVRPVTFVISPIGRVIEVIAEAQDYDYFRRRIEGHVGSVRNTETLKH